MDPIITRVRGLVAQACPTLLLLVWAFGLPACRKEDKAATTTTTSATPSEHEQASVTKPAPEPEPPPGPLEPSVTWRGIGLAAPESVLVDEDADQYLVSNMDGPPLQVDNKGFISRLSPDGKMIEARWIDARKNKVKLNAPKGMAIRDGELYVADIGTVRVFDRKTGAPLGAVRIPGATFLNDVALAPDGRVLVSDIGLRAKKGALEPSFTDAVWAIGMDKKAKPIAKKRLGGPNGLLPTPTKTWVAALGSGELYSLDAKGNVGDIQKLPHGALASIVLVGNDLVIPSWESGAIYRGKAGAEFHPIIEGVRSPADLAYDRKRGRLLVPLLMDDEVRAYDVKE